MRDVWCTILGWLGPLPPTATTHVLSVCPEWREVILSGDAGRCLSLSIHFRRDMPPRHLYPITSAVVTMNDEVIDPELVIKHLQQFHVLGGHWWRHSPHMIARLRKFTVAHCQRMRRVPYSLGCVRHVELHDCSYVRDVSALSVADKVVLSRCPNVRSVAALASVPTVHLSRCGRIMDISPLANINTLKVTLCRHVLHFPTQWHVESLSMSVMNIKSLGSMHKVPHVHLSRCPAISNLTPLQEAVSVELIGCVGVRDVSPLARVPRVIIAKCPNVTDLSQLTSVPHLRVERCFNATLVPTHAVASLLPSTDTVPLLPAKGQITPWGRGLDTDLLELL